MPEKRVQRGYQYGPNIKNQIVRDPVGTKGLLEITFARDAKAVQNQHVYDQMRPVGMQKGMEEHPVILSPLDNLIRIKLVFIEEAVLAKSNDGKSGSN
jgi:hypothetical protein